MPYPAMNPEKRTTFVFDLMPWRLEFCMLRTFCEVPEAMKIWIKDLPEAPEPGRIPKDVDHLHILPAYSQHKDRNARDDHKWRTIMLAVARCEHGHLQTHYCKHCPSGKSPIRAGERIGTTSHGVPVVIPQLAVMNDITEWTGPNLKERSPS